MPDTQINTIPSANQNSQNNSIIHPQQTKTVGLSPWDEPLDLPPEPIQSSKVTGTLSEDPKPQGVKIFNVPNEVEVSVAPAIIKPENVGTNMVDNMAGEKIPDQQLIPKTEAVVSQPTVLAQPQSEEKVENIELAKLPPEIAQQAEPSSAPQAMSPSSNIMGDIQKPAIIDKPISTEDPLQKGPGVTSSQAGAPVVAPIPKAQQENIISKFISSGRLKLLGIILVPIALLCFLTYLTEIGMISIGLEKVYGSLRIDLLWGGLSDNGEYALGQAFVQMKSHTEFKVRGTMIVDIDRTINSPITKPLVSYIPPIYVYVPQKATLASVNSYDIGSEVIYPGTVPDYTSTEDVSDSSDETTSPSVSSTLNSSSSDSSSGSISETQEDQQSAYPSYESLTNTIKQLTFNIDSQFGGEGNDVILSYRQPIGTSEIKLKNEDNMLWVKSNSIKFGEQWTPTSWLQYNLKDLSANGPAGELFSAGSDTGLSAQGRRVGNEKIGSVRTYKYQFESMSIGDSLVSLGISSEMIQTVTGTVWIGINDKTIRRAQLKITPSPSYAITGLNVDLQFYDFDIVESFSKPSEDDIVSSDSDQSASSTSSTQTGSSTSSSVSTPTQTTTTPAVAINANDTQRKADLLSIKNALAQYYLANGKYPAAKSIVKLNVADNSLSKALVTRYLARMPEDPNDAGGWYYGYKSVDGKSYSLSARLEESDPAATISGDMYLYYLTNE